MPTQTVLNHSFVDDVLGTRYFVARNRLANVLQFRITVDYAASAPMKPGQSLRAEFMAAVAGHNSRLILAVTRRLREKAGEAVLKLNSLNHALASIWGDGNLVNPSDTPRIEQEKEDICVAFEATCIEEYERLHSQLMQLWKDYGGEAYQALKLHNLRTGYNGALSVWFAANAVASWVYTGPSPLSTYYSWQFVSSRAAVVIFLSAREIDTIRESIKRGFISFDICASEAEFDNGVFRVPPRSTATHIWQNVYEAAAGLINRHESAVLEAAPSVVAPGIPPNPVSALMHSMHSLGTLQKTLRDYKGRIAAAIIKLESTTALYQQQSAILPHGDPELDRLQVQMAKDKATILQHQHHELDYSWALKQFVEASGLDAHMRKFALFNAATEAIPVAARPSSSALWQAYRWAGFGIREGWFVARQFYPGLERVLADCLALTFYSTGAGRLRELEEAAAHWREAKAELWNTVAPVYNAARAAAPYVAAAVTGRSPAELGFAAPVALGPDIP